jgi:glycosyltransferase involved in cell wall biosynthesis
VNILFTRFPLESARGGAEAQTLALMRGLHDKGHGVQFLGSCPILLQETKNYQLKNINSSIGIPPVTKWGAVSFLWRQRSMRRALIEAIETMSPRPDVICMLSLSEKLLLTDWAVAQGIRVVWIEHDGVGRWLIRNPWLSRLRRVASLATTIVVSRASADLYRALGWPADGIVVIPNGVEMHDVSHVAPSPEASAELRVGCVARLTRDKGVHVLIEAVESLPDVRLTIVGSGRDEAAVHAAIARSPARDRITVLARVEHIAPFFGAIDAFVLPSISHDPFGMAAAEAMAAGVPVVVTDACGIAGELRSGKDAIVVHADQAHALVDALRMLHDAALRQRVGAAGRDTAQRLFSIPVMVDRYEKAMRPA